MKQKMIELDPICEQEGAPYLLTVHDEHDISVPKTKSKKVPPRIKELLETFDGEKSPIMCRVPILSSVAVGPNWWEASK
jgi:DNA polymerase I-like protein with 3'-5' exonuclease and polymerase domains